MSSYLAFMKKEWLENIRNYKFFIILTIFLVLGILSPFTAKMLPQILGTIDINGAKITIPEATAIDSWAQFYSNVGQIGLISLVIVYSGMISNELSKGTLINMLTKGLKRKIVIIAKFSVTSMIWTICLSSCFALTYLYTMIYWSMSGLSNILLACLCLWLFGELLISLMIFGGTLVKGNSSSLLFSGLSVVIMLILGIIPGIDKFNPISLATTNMSLLTNQLALSDLISNIIVTFCLICALFIGAISVFNKKEI